MSLKINQEIADEIREKYKADKVTQKQLAEEYGLCHQSISQIVNGKIWREDTVSYEIHNFKNTKLYYVWNTMKQRCVNPNVTRYKRYGGRGISVCEEWKKSFLAFHTWANAAGYKQGLTIDRIDNDGDYKPSNCRWVTNLENRRNR